MNVDGYTASLEHALRLWIKYAKTNYSGDGMSALSATRAAMSNGRLYPHLEKVGRDVGLEGRLLEIFLSYYTARHDIEGLEYAREWAQRFKDGVAYLAADLEGQRVLDRVGYKQFLGE